jgi:transcriptional antiterminator RfaH
VDTVAAKFISGVEGKTFSRAYVSHTPHRCFLATPYPFSPSQRSLNLMSTTTTRPSWYLIHCKAREDERALAHLHRQGFSCYRPVRQVERCRNGRKYWVADPLFPRYLFIHLDCVNDNWSPIRSTRGVLGMVRFSNEPVPVRDEVIEGLRARLGSSTLAVPYLKPGERVQIIEGAFSQLEAIFLANDGDQRVVLLLNILQQDQRLVFPLESVRKVRESSVA